MLPKSSDSNSQQVIQTDVEILVVGDGSEELCRYLTWHSCNSEQLNGESSPLPSCSCVIKTALGINRISCAVSSSNFWSNFTFVCLEPFLLDPFLINAVVAPMEIVIVSYFGGDTESLERGLKLFEALSMKDPDHQMKGKIASGVFDSDIKASGLPSAVASQQVVNTVGPGLFVEIVKLNSDSLCTDSSPPSKVSQLIAEFQNSNFFRINVNLHNSGRSWLRYSNDNTSNLPSGNAEVWTSDRMSVYSWIVERCCALPYPLSWCQGSSPKVSLETFLLYLKNSKAYRICRQQLNFPLKVESSIALDDFDELLDVNSINNAQGAPESASFGTNRGCKLS